MHKSLGVVVISLWMTTIVHAQVAITTIPTKPPSDQVDGQRRVGRNFSHRDLAPLNTEMFDLSTQTGGDFYFWGEGEFGSEAASKVIAHSVLATQTILYEYGDLKDKLTLRLAIDPYQYHYTFFAGIQSKDRIEFVRPDGEVLTVDEEGVQIYQFQRMLVATINAPMAGNWTIRLTGKGKYLVSVRK